MRKIKNISLALAVTPLIFVGCMQEKVSRIIPSKSTDNYTHTILTQTKKSLETNQTSDEIISSSELNKLVELVKNKIAIEEKRDSIEITPIKTANIETTSTTEPYKSTSIQTPTYNITYETQDDTLQKDSSAELTELMSLVSSSLDDDIKGVDGIYTTPIVINEDIQKKNHIAEAKKVIEIKKVKKIVEDKFKEENEIISTAIAFLDTKYIWAANGPDAFDCSGFTKYVYKEHGLTIPRYSGNQAKFGKTVAYNELQVGDLVFFDTEKRYKRKVNHVGIYMGDNKFIHASSAKKKVIITSFKKKRFYKRRFLWGQRILKHNSTYASL